MSETDKLLFERWNRLCGRLDKVGFDGLSPREQVFFCVWVLWGEVDNGGFAQYMFNSSGDHAIRAVEALRELGAAELATVCERFYALLPGGRPGPHPDARQAQLDEAAARMGEVEFDEACTRLEAEFRAGEEALQTLLLRYLENDTTTS